MRNLDKEIAIIQKFKAEHPDKAYKLYIETSDDFDFHDETESEDYIAVLIAELETETPAENPFWKAHPPTLGMPNTSSTSTNPLPLTGN